MPNESVILTWNATNWVTVVLMAAIGFFVLGLAQKLIANARSSSSGTAVTTAGD